MLQDDAIVPSDDVPLPLTLSKTAVKITPGETAFLDYVRHLHERCQPGEVLLKEGFQAWTPAALLQAPSVALQKSRIVDYRLGNNVEHLRVVIRSMFGKTEKSMSVHWSPNRQGWARSGGQIHYFVNWKRLKNPPARCDVPLISLCEREGFANYGVFLKVDQTTADVCPICSGILPEFTPLPPSQTSQPASSR